MQLPGRERTRSSCSSGRSRRDERAASCRRSCSRAIDGDNYGKLVAVQRSPIASAPSAVEGRERDRVRPVHQQPVHAARPRRIDGREGRRAADPDRQRGAVRPADLDHRARASQPFPRYRFVAAVVGDRAVLGYDVNDAVTALVTGSPTQLQQRRRRAGGRSRRSSRRRQRRAARRRPRRRRRRPARRRPSRPSNATAAQLLAEAAARVRRGRRRAARPANLGEYQAHIHAGPGRRRARPRPSSRRAASTDDHRRPRP